MTDLTIGNAIFRVQVDGDATKPALLLSNSLGADLSMWDSQIPELTKYFRVVRYDGRGHGGSTVGDAPVSLAGLAGDVLAILDALAIERAHFIGLSLGGLVGIWLLVHAPDRIDRAVLANTAARFGSPATWNARIASVLERGMADNAAATIERWFSPEFAKREPKQVETVYDTLSKTSPQGYAQACAALRDADLRASLQAIDREVLIISGRRDPVVSDQDLDALVTDIPSAQHVALDARHLSNIEAPVDFNAATISFLTRPKRKPAASATRPAAKAAPLKRGGAGRRSNAARRPLKKVAAKRTAAKKTRSSASTKVNAATRRRPKKRSTGRPVTTTKPAAKRPSKSSTRKAATTRRPTPTAKARGPATKPKTATRKKAVVKKPNAKVVAKKLPTPRRKPQRPTGRRKK